MVKGNGNRTVCNNVLDRRGTFAGNPGIEDLEKFNDWMERLTKWGWKHITMLRFIDFSITVEGLHRAGPDDWDAHAARFNNRIIRFNLCPEYGIGHLLHPVPT